MATFSPRIHNSNNNTIPNHSLSPPTTTSSSSLSYHHLQSPLNRIHHQQNNHSSTSSSSSSSSTADDDHRIQLNQDNSTVYLNPNEFSLCLPSNQPNSSFDVVLSTSPSSAHFNHDPLVRHFFHYRPNESNFPGNYYHPSMPPGSFVNTFDYPTSYSNPSTETTMPHPYMPYQHGMIKQTENFIPSTPPPPLAASSCQCPTTTATKYLSMDETNS